MIELVEIAEVGANIADAVLAVVFLAVILGRRKELPVAFFAALSVILICADSYLQARFPDSRENTIIYLVFTLLFSLICLGGSFGQGLLYFMIWNIILMSESLGYAAVFGYMKRRLVGDTWEMSDAARIYYLIGVKLLLLLVVIVCLQVLRRHRLKSAMPVMNIVVFAISILIGIVLDIMLDYEYLDSRGRAAIGIAMIGVAVINVFVYIATYQLNRSQALEMENRLLRLSQEEQKESMERMLGLQEQNKILRHDLRHYFTVFRELLLMGDPEQAQIYVEEVLNTKLRPEGVYMTGDDILDAILNHCDGLCRQKGIAFCADIRALLPERRMEFAIVLLNLLENAIEAAEQETEKRVEFEIRTSAGVLLVTVRNKISHSVLLENPELKTKKGDADLHGLGRKSVKKLIRSMEGTFYEEEKDGYFTSNIAL